MDHIHAPYALIEFKYLVFVFGEVLEKYSFLFPGFSRSTGRSTALEVSRPDRSTDVHERARLCALEGRSTDPVDRQRASALWKTPVDRAVDRQRELLSVPEARSTGAPTVGFLTVSGRPSGRPAEAWKQETGI